MPNYEGLFRTCKDCGGTSDEKPFPKTVKSRCKECTSIKQKEWRLANPGYHTNWKRRNRNKVNERQRSYRAENPEKHREYQRNYYENVYKPRVAELYERNVANQPDTKVCGVCDEEKPKDDYYLTVWGKLKYRCKECEKKKLTKNDS